MGPRDGLDAVASRKTSFFDPAGSLTPVHLAFGLSDECHPGPTWPFMAQVSVLAFHYSLEISLDASAFS